MCACHPSPQWLTSTVYLCESMAYNGHAPRYQEHACHVPAYARSSIPPRIYWRRRARITSGLGRRYIAPSPISQYTLILSISSEMSWALQYRGVITPAGNQENIIIIPGPSTNLIPAVLSAKRFGTFGHTWKSAPLYLYYSSTCE